MGGNILAVKADNWCGETMEKTREYRRLLKPLLDALEKSDGLHISVIGSAVFKDLTQLTDIDVFVILKHTDYSHYSLICSSLVDCCGRLRDESGYDWFIEPRRGPFKPDPDIAVAKPIHLILEDRDTLVRSSPSMLLNWHTNGLILAGEPITSLRSFKGSEASRQVRADFSRQLALLYEDFAAENISYHVWVFAETARLIKSAVPLTTLWSYRCLLQYAAAVYDGLANQEEMRSDHTGFTDSREFVTYVRKETNEWRSLPDRWKRVRHEVMRMLRGRIAALQQHEGDYRDETG